MSGSVLDRDTCSQIRLWTYSGPVSRERSCTKVLCESTLKSIRIHTVLGVHDVYGFVLEECGI